MFVAKYFRGRATPPPTVLQRIKVVTNKPLNISNLLRAVS
nr:MAG TPA: hypothetical protein [Inoviridae sp.]